MHKKPGSLMEFVSTTLETNNYLNASAWESRLPEQAWATTDPREERFLINREWRIILGTIPGEETFNVRYCLIDTGDVEDWKRIFLRGVLPFILKHPGLV